MPLNGTGTYTPPTPEYPAIPGDIILASDFNAIISDMSAALSQAIYNNGEQTYVANQPMGGFGLTGLGSLAGNIINITATTALNLPDTATAITQTTGNSSTKLATTAFVQGVAFSTALPAQAGNAYNFVTTDGANASWTNTINFARGSVAMHATAMDLWAQPNIIDGTGAAATVTDIAAAPRAGATRRLYPIAGSVITHGAVFTVQGGSNALADAGDIWDFEAITTTTFQVQITKASGAALTAGVITAVATGALANGDLVSLNSDGTVSVVAGTDPTATTAVVFEASTTGDPVGVYDPSSGKIVIAYVFNSSSGYCVVGTISGGAITFGSRVQFTSNNIAYPSICYDPTSEQVVICFNDQSTSAYGKAVVGKVSGTSMTFGSITTFLSANTGFISCSFDVNADRVAVAYRNQTSGDVGYIVVGTISGTSISFGTPVAVTGSTTMSNLSTVYDPISQKIVIFGPSPASNQPLNAFVCTVSGTSATVSAKMMPNSLYVDYVKATYTRDGIIAVLSTTSASTGYKKTLQLMKVLNGLLVTVGNPVNFPDIQSSGIYGMAYDENTDRIIMAVRYAGVNGAGMIVSAKLSTIETEEPIQITTNLQGSGVVVISTGSDIVIGYKDGADSSKGKAVIYDPMPSNLESYIGISDGAYADGETANIQTIGSVDDAQTGLTIGKEYFVQVDGTLSTYPDIPVVKAGVALSATQLLVKG